MCKWPEVLQSEKATKKEVLPTCSSQVLNIAIVSYKYKYVYTANMPQKYVGHVNTYQPQTHLIPTKNLLYTKLEELLLMIELMQDLL